MHQSQVTSQLIRVPKDLPLNGELIESALDRVPNRELLLTSRAGVIINCDRGLDREPDSSLLEPGLMASARWLRNSTDPIFSRKDRTLVDIGCGMYGSSYANALQTQISGTHVQWVDRAPSMIFSLDKPAEVKHCANAEKLPFQDRAFDLALIVGVTESGLSKLPDAFMPVIDPTGFEIVKEAARVLSPGGLLMINFSRGTNDPKETLITLRDAGFDSISHIHRIIWFGGIPSDLYACRKNG